MSTERELLERAVYALELCAPGDYSVLVEKVIDDINVHLKKPETEVRADGETVRIDRWEIGIRRIVALLWGNRREFEIDGVVEAVRKLTPAPFNEGDDEGLVRAVATGYGTLPQPVTLKYLSQNMAQKAEQLLDAINAWYRAQETAEDKTIEHLNAVEDAANTVDEAMVDLRSCVHEFRNRHAKNHGE